MRALFSLLAASFLLSFAAHAQTVPVRVSWASPGANAQISGRATLTLSGQGFRNVELFRDGRFLTRATVTTDGTRATATVDTSQLANGPLTLSAHAWNSPPGTSFTSEGDAGARTFTVNNAVPVRVQWSAPAANASIAGRTQFVLTGQGFVNVELFRNGQMLSRAAVSSDRTRARANIDTSQLPNGP